MTSKGFCYLSLKFCFLVLVFVLLVAMVSGCGGTYTRVSYYYPDWTPDGRIICVKEVETYREGGGMFPALGGGSTLVSTEYYITTMSEEGTQETDIKRINGIGKVAASPLGNYIAYTDGSYIKIIDSSGTIINSINGANEINSIAWSSDEAKIAFSTFQFQGSPSWEIYTAPRDDDGSRKEFLTYGDLGEWSSNGEFLVYDLYVYSDNIPIDGGLYLYEFSSGKIIKLSTMEGAHPDFFPDGYRIIYDLGGKGLKIVNRLTFEKQKVYNDYAFYPKVSPCGNKVVFGDGYNSGIWLINIDGSRKIKIKD